MIENNLGNQLEFGLKTNIIRLKSRLSLILEDYSRLKIDFFLISKISIDFYLDFGAEKSDDNRIKSSKISLFFTAD